jgi:hypothetical protein
MRKELDFVVSHRQGSIGWRRAAGGGAGVGRLRQRRAAKLGEAESAWRNRSGSRLCHPPRHAGPPPSSPALAPAARESRAHARMDALLPPAVPAEREVRALVLPGPLDVE